MLRLFTCMLLMLAPSALGAAQIKTQRVPHGGIQPQVAVDAKGVVHLIYFKGDARAGDLFYVRSADDGATWSKPLRVNSQEASAIAAGTMRHAHLALGRNGRVHVAWMGSQKAQPKPPGGKGSPMLYARLNDAGDGFEAQRNVITERPGLDGGGALAADERGNVYVAWHAPIDAKNHDEEARRVWVARSADDGKSFAPEIAASEPIVGACGCCGLNITTDRDGAVYILFRNAREMVNRDMILLTAAPAPLGATLRFKAVPVSQWKIGQCPASTAALTPLPDGSGVLAGWEEKQQVLWTTLRDKADGVDGVADAVSPQGAGRARKHPSLASNGELVLLTWDEGAGWEKPAIPAWQLFTLEGKSIAGSLAKGPAMAVWSFPTCFATRTGEFVIVH